MLRPYAIGLLFQALASSAGAAGGDDAPAGAPRTTPDPVFFEERVQPLLLSRCAFAGCHDGPGAGRLILKRPDFTGRMTLDRTEHNLATALQFVAFGEPMNSRLILKPLVKRDGGVPHSGDAYDFRKTSEEYSTFADWIGGVELRDVPPIADAGGPRAAKIGEEVVLDGGRSRDRRGRDLRYSWRIESRPEGSTPVLKAADSCQPRFKGDRDGAYTVSLVVDNGETRSDPASMTVELDSLPFLVLEGERATDLQGFHIADDPAAAGGKVLRVGQEVEVNGTATARLAFTLPEGGPYRLFAKVHAAPDAAPLWFQFDDGDEVEFRPEPAPGYRLTPVATAGVRAVLREASGEVWTGSAETRDGRLWLRGSVQRPATFTFGVVERQGGIDFGVRVERPDAATLADALAVVLFHARDGRNADFAGIHLGRQRFVIGRLVDGRVEILAERRQPLRPDADYALRLDFKDDAAFLFPPDGEVLEAKLRPSTDGAQIGLLATAAVSWDAFACVAGARRLDLTFDQDGRPAGHLAAGAHTLGIRADAITAPAIDELFVARADFDDAVSAQTRHDVRALYLDLWGRVPTAAELMMAAGLDRAGLARRLIGSLEFYENLYELELYYFLLLDNFRPKTPQLDAIPARLLNGQLTVKDAIQEIAISQYFNARNPGNDTFVSVVLEQLLGVVVQDEPKLLEAGKSMYDGHQAQFLGRQGDSQSDVVYAVLGDERFLPYLLRRHYERVLMAPPLPADLQRWATMLASDGSAYETIVREWIASPAYDQALATRRAKTDHMWIRSLFLDLLDRKPTFDEYRNFRNAVQALSDSAPLRAVLAQVILDSGQVPLPDKAAIQPAAFVQDLYLRLLGRMPTAAERDGLVKALAESACTPAMVVAAIVSSAEYQGY